jgi:signal transduction histidine kinase
MQQHAHARELRGADRTTAPQARRGAYLEREPLVPLHRLRMTYRVILGWTIWYGAASWGVEWAFSHIDRSSAEPFLFGMSRAVYAFYWGLAAWVAVRMTDWRPITSGRQYARIAIHFAVCLAVVVAWGTLAYYTNVAIVPGWEPQGLGRMLASTSKNVIFGYGVLVVLVHVVWWVRRHQAHEMSLLQQAQRATEAQLQVLKMELQPHFLFNALHSVSSLIASDPDAANETLVRISDMLRHAVRTSRVQEVRLREELDTLRLYTDIEQVRFGERLRITWDVPEDLRDAAVPHMLLQPLVENAIKHAVEMSSASGKIVLRARELTGQGSEPALELTIVDDGPGLDARRRSARGSAGVGIKNTRERLAELYGERQSFSISSASGGGSCVRIVMPLRRLDGGDGVRGGEAVAALSAATDGARLPSLPSVRRAREASALERRHRNHSREETTA